jgi:hypothetical protein
MTLNKCQDLTHECAESKGSPKEQREPTLIDGCRRKESTGGHCTQGNVPAARLVDSFAELNPRTTLTSSTSSITVPLDQSHGPALHIRLARYGRKESGQSR